MPRLWIAVSVTMVAASCGGSSSNGTSDKGPPRLTQQQFVTAGNRVCIRSDRRIYSLGGLTVDPKGWAATARAARVGLREMAALRPPLAKQAQFEKLLTLGRRLEQGIERTRTALREKNYPAARAAQLAATKDDTSIHTVARNLGLTFCQQLLTNWPA